MKERRRHPRHVTSWPVRLWLSDACFLSGYTVDVATHGIRFRMLDGKLAGLVKLGKPYRVQVELGEMAGELTQVGEVRHIANGEIGVELKEGLPLEKTQGGPYSDQSLRFVPARSFDTLNVVPSSLYVRPGVRRPSTASSASPTT